MKFALVIATSLAIAGAASAAAPQPTRAINPSFYSGRWYEIARVPNLGQRDCQAPVTQFTPQGGSGDVAFISTTGEFAVSQVCHKGSAAGPEKVYSTKGRILPGARNAKFEMSFLGGMKKQEYWVLDCSGDGSWAIMATPGGNYVWLLARKASLPDSAKAAAIARIRALGYQQKLEFPAHA